MRILVVGAGGIGGYFGGRLLQAKRDVTFLVRERRAQQLRESGLSIRSPAGDLKLAAPPAVLARDLPGRGFDLIVLSCKAYDLESAIDSFAPAVGAGTLILPLLNGLKHLDTLEARFGSGALLGGQCFISAALDDDGTIVHFNNSHTLTFGPRTASQSAAAAAIAKEFSAAAFETRLTDSILLEMWEKWVFIATAAGITCLMRSSIADVVCAGGVGLATALLDECADIARQAGFTPRPEVLQRHRAGVSAAGSPMMASMLRDIERGGRTEFEQIIGDLLHRAGSGAERRYPLLHVAYVHLGAYEARRAREHGRA